MEKRTEKTAMHVLKLVARTIGPGSDPARGWHTYLTNAPAHWLEALAALDDLDPPDAWAAVLGWFEEHGSPADKVAARRLRAAVEACARTSTDGALSDALRQVGQQLISMEHPIDEIGYALRDLPPEAATYFAAQRDARRFGVPRALPSGAPPVVIEIPEYGYQYVDGARMAERAGCRPPEGMDAAARWMTCLCILDELDDLAWTAARRFIERRGGGGALLASLDTTADPVRALAPHILEDLLGWHAHLAEVWADEEAKSARSAMAFGGRETAGGHPTPA